MGTCVPRSVHRCNPTPLNTPTQTNAIQTLKKIHAVLDKTSMFKVESTKADGSLFKHQVRA